MECVYIGMGAEQVSFRSPSGGSIFYLLSCPAHRKYPSRRMGVSEAEAAQIGKAENASCRKIYRYILSLIHI